MENTSLLKSKRFLPLFITQFFGAFNDNVFKNAFLIWFTFFAAEKFHINPAMMVTVASGLFILPFFLFSSLAGQVADKYEKTRIVQIVKIAEILIMSLAFFGFYYENISLLLTLLFLMGVHSSFFGPIKYSLLPLHLKDNELVHGNALIEGSTFLAILLGTIFGGVFILTENGIFIICISVICFGFVGLFASFFIPKSAIAAENIKINFNIFSETKKIISFARKDKTVFHSILGISWFWLIGATFLSQFPVYTKNIISGNEHIVTLFLTIFSVGIAIGSLICSKTLKGKISTKTVPVGILGMSISIFIFVFVSYFYQNLILISLSLLMISISGGLFIVPLYTLMQHNSDKKHLSRIIAANNVMNALFMVISAISLVILYKLKFDLLQIFLLIGFVNMVLYFTIL